MIDFDTQRKVMSRQFSIAVHKNTFVDYLEIILDESGRAYYAVPSHQKAMLELLQLNGLYKGGIL